MDTILVKLGAITLRLLRWYFPPTRTTDRRYGMYEPHTPGTPPGESCLYIFCWVTRFCHLGLVLGKASSARDRVTYKICWNLFVFRKGLEGPRGHGHGIDGKMLNTSQPFHQPPDFQRASLALGLLPLPPLLLIILVFLLPAASSPLWLKTLLTCFQLNAMFQILF